MVGTKSIRIIQISLTDPSSLVWNERKKSGNRKDPVSQLMNKAEQPLLKTKLFIPRVPREMVPRLHLIKRLNQGKHTSLTMISAPPGFGKTTILAEWAVQSDTPVAWLSLDQNDNDPTRFLIYLSAAVRKVADEAGEEALVLLGSSQPYPTQAILASLISSLEILQQPVVLVLDDFHVLTEPSLHEAFSFLLEHLPQQVRFIVATRADPPIPLARIRALGKLQELRADDLRFSAAETASFLKKVMGLDLSEDDITALEARTEGWIAGLQMAALSMRGRKGLSDFVKGFSGSHRFILDYLVEEVINRQPEEIQRFLLRSSILENITSPLCDALIEPEGSKESGSQAILEYLERSNLFLTPLDDERRWFRYHRLFADLLRARLQHAEPGIVSSLHLKAAGWYKQKGFISEAIRHAFAAQDYERAADMIEENGQQRWSMSDTEFLSLVGALPIEVLHARPSLGIYQAWILFIYGQYEASETLLRALVENIPPAEQFPETLGSHSFINLLLIYIAEMSGKELVEELPGRQALEFVSERHLGMRNSADVLYAYLLDLRGDFAASEELLLSAVQRDVAAGGATAVPICISSMARKWLLQGRLKEAADLCRRYIEYVRERGEKRFFIAGNLYLVLSSILREWNRLDEAGQMIQAGFEANEPWKLPQVDLVNHFAKTRLQQARGDLDGALATLEQLEKRIQGKSIAPDLKSDLRYLKVKLWLAKGEREIAWSHSYLSRPLEPLDFRHELDHILLARIFLSEGKPAEALELLERLGARAESGGRYGRLLEIRILAAIALAGWEPKNQSVMNQAFEGLAACLALAAREGYLRIFLDEGKVMQELLIAYLDSPAPIHTSYVSQILQAFSPNETIASSSQCDLIEPLTRRELEVLALLCAGASNRDIAEKLVITVSAVKKHTGNIYGKLSVNSRTQAIVRTHQLNLLS
jgi:LuxR family transcriptional regulator, maltose regulon positive regulatory protein